MMMLRTTISRIKKVCTIAFVPRQLRGDQRCATVRFEILSYAEPRKAQKSTKSTDNEDSEKTGKRNESDYLFMSEKKPSKNKSKSSDGPDPVAYEIINENMTPIVATKAPIIETQSEKCQRLIDQAFGKDMKPVTGEQYYSQSVDIDETRREIKESEMAKLKFEQEKNVDKPLSDDRINYGIYRDAGSYSEDTEEPEYVINRSALEEAKKETNEDSGVPESMDDINLVQQTLNVHLTARNVPEFTEEINADKIDKSKTEDSKQPTLYKEYTKDNLPLQDVVTKDNVDDSVHNQGKQENAMYNAKRDIHDATFRSTVSKDNPYTSKNADILAGTVDINSNYVDREFDLQQPSMTCRPISDAVKPNKINADSFKPIFTKQSLIDVYTKKAKKPIVEDWNVNFGEPEIMNATQAEPDETELNSLLYPDDFSFVVKKSPKEGSSNLKQPTVIKATTASENEETLAQKLEHIDETPLVEAHKPKIEGFNVTPRILGDTEPAFTCYSDKKLENQHGGQAADVPATFDEVAKRCLDSPTGKIDEILLKEMEKLGIPINPNKDTPSHLPLMDDDLVQMDVLKKSTRGPSRELDFESRRYNRNAMDQCSVDKLYPTRYVCSEKVLKTDDDYEDDCFDSVLDTPHITPHDGTCETLTPPITALNSSPVQNPVQSSVQAQICTPVETLNDSPISTRVELETPVHRNVETPVQTRVGTVAPDSVPEPDPSKMEEDEENFHLHPNQVLIDPYDKKTLKYDIGEYDPAERFDPSKKFSYYYVPESSRTKELDSKETVEEITKEPQNSMASTQPIESNPDPIKYDAEYSRSWNDLQSFTKIDLEEPKLEPTRNTQPFYQQFSDKYSSVYYPQNMHIPYYMWREQMAQESPQSVHQVYEKSIDVPESINTFEVDDPKDPNDDKPKPPTQKPPAKKKEKFIDPMSFYMPETVSDKPCRYGSDLDNKVKARSSPLIQNKTNVNVSDDIWDEHNNMDAEHTKPRENVNLSGVWEDDHLDPKHVLTCNETCAMSPKPLNVANQESSRTDAETFNETETKRHQNSPAELENGLPQSKTVTDAYKNHSVSNILSADRLKQTVATSIQLPETLNSSANPLPSLKEDVALSELLRRVRERSRMECRNELKALGVEVEPATGKCGRKAPRCPPLAPRSPPNNPIPPPPFGLPTLKRRPPACKPKKRSNKCSACEMDISKGVHLGPTITQTAGMKCEVNELGTVSVAKSKADLTEEVIDRLQTLGKMLGGVFRPGTVDGTELGNVVRDRRGSKTFLARDYEPWSPIPSWPTPKPAQRKKKDCSPGCKIIPPPRIVHDPACPNLKPCTGFPKIFPKKTFSLLDCFAVSLGENKVYDLGEF